MSNKVILARRWKGEVQTDVWYYIGDAEGVSNTAWLLGSPERATQLTEEQAKSVGHLALLRNGALHVEVWTEEVADRTPVHLLELARDGSLVLFGSRILRSEETPSADSKSYLLCHGCAIGPGMPRVLIGPNVGKCGKCGRDNTMVYSPSLSESIQGRAEEVLRFVLKHREEYLKAWIAKTGVEDPSSVVQVEQQTYAWKADPGVLSTTIFYVTRQEANRRYEMNVPTEKLPGGG